MASRSSMSATDRTASRVNVAHSSARLIDACANRRITRRARIKRIVAPRRRSSLNAAGVRIARSLCRISVPRKRRHKAGETHMLCAHCAPRHEIAQAHTRSAAAARLLRSRMPSLRALPRAAQQAPHGAPHIRRGCRRLACAEENDMRSSTRSIGDSIARTRRAA